MSEPKDPERLLADALRAQAVFAPQPERTAGTNELAKPAESGTAGLPPQYGLLSGAGADSLARERAALDSVSPEPSTIREPIATKEGGAPLPVYWLLLLAILLGLAAGSVVGLLTLL
jgi:hypothetical protein